MPYSCEGGRGEQENVVGTCGSWGGAGPAQGKGGGAGRDAFEGKGRQDTCGSSGGGGPACARPCSAAEGQGRGGEVRCVRAHLPAQHASTRLLGADQLLLLSPSPEFSWVGEPLPCTASLHALPGPPPPSHLICDHADQQLLAGDALLRGGEGQEARGGTCPEGLTQHLHRGLVKGGHGLGAARGGEGRMGEGQ